MPRPINKTDLLQSSETQFQKLQNLILSLSEQDQESDFSFDPEFLILLHWIGENQKGVKTSFLPAPYTWKTYGEMNRALRKKHQTTSLKTAKQFLNKSHSEVMKLIDSFSDQELFTKAYFSRTGTTSLGSYCISATSSHYDWAMKKLKKASFLKK